MLVTDADERMPESRRLRLHRIPAMVQRRRSILKRMRLSNAVHASAEGFSVMGCPSEAVRSAASFAASGEDVIFSAVASVTE